LRSVDMRGMADLLEEHGEAISRIVNGQIRAGRIRTP
jgi:plasmid maintenance system antidote protein VapI